jgi:hypothetical protein
MNFSMKNQLQNSEYQRKSEAALFNHSSGCYYHVAIQFHATKVEITGGALFSFIAGGQEQ